MTRREFAFLFAAALAIGVGTSSAPALAASPQLIEAAKKEGVVSWYTSLVQNQAARPLADAFEKKYGVKVEIVGGSPPDVFLKLVDEGKAKRMHADVSHGSSNPYTLIDAGLVDKYTPDSAATFPADMKDRDGYHQTMAVAYFVVAINTSMVKGDDIPKSWNDLLNPKWKGKIAWGTGAQLGGPQGFMAMIINTMGEKDGMDFLKKLAAQQVINVPANQRVVLDNVIAGEYPIQIMAASHHVEISKKAGAPVEWLKIAPAIAQSDVTFVMKDAPHPNAARLLNDFILSDEGQEVLAKAGYLPANPKVPASVPGLKPEVGNFKAHYLDIRKSLVDVPNYVKIFNENFR